MKLTPQKVEEVILDILGEEGLRLVKELRSKENISEFSLATRLKRDIKLVRRMLYKLYNYNLVASSRKKDKQKGWYIYYWTLLPENVKFHYLKNKKILLEKLKGQLQREQTEQFYSCPKKCIRLDFNQSLDFEFRCPECGELLVQEQDPKRIEELEKKIEKLRRELESEERIVKKGIKKISKGKPKKKR